MRGVISAAGYVPYHRLDRSEIAAFFGSGSGQGRRAVASYDEDTTTMGHAAADLALRSTPVKPVAVWFATSAPAYLEKTNAAAIHAALRLDPAVGALDFGGAIRSGIGALRTALAAGGPTLVVAAARRDGPPTGADEAAAGDGAAALLVGDGSDGPVLAEYLGAASRTVEVTERWRTPGEARSRSWEERLGAHVLGPVGAEALHAALVDSGLGDTAGIDRLAVTGLNSRAVAAAVKAIGAEPSSIVDPLIDTVGNTATAHPALLLCSALEQASPGETVAVVALADGAEAVILRATDELADHRPIAPVSAQMAAGGPVSYGRFLAWRRMVDVEPPNRPPPNRPSSPAAHRRTGWKYGFTGSRDRSSEMVHLPPARVSEKGGAADDMEPESMAHTTGTVRSFTVDRLAYSPSPPTVFAVVDFDGGGRAPLELTDVDAGEVHVGLRVVPTFRRLYTADEIHNYFWKARPARAGEAAGTQAGAAK
ncbi:MAG: hydroxymethylglutaryl-CoA synthase [Acidimicrobiaceae bacterium]|nr:hydroxymethylglutaryl-CoA synthase [Acidimicrobiaceae bacterium]